MDVPTVPIKSIFTEYFLIRMLIDLASMIVLVRLIYFRVYAKQDLYAPFYLLNFIVFLLAYMLKVSGGFDSFGSAIGLLAAFSLMRFRTDTISMNDMTYLFIVMAVALINSAMVGSYLEIIALNGLIVVAVFVVDGRMLFRSEKIQEIEMDNLEHIKPEDHKLLIEQLRGRTGLNITKITIDSIDFVKKKATVKIYYY